MPVIGLSHSVICFGVPARTRTPIQLGAYESPLGTYHLVASPHGLIFLGTNATASRDVRSWRDRRFDVITGDSLLLPALTQLAAYFSGTLKHFTVPLDLHGTSFQKAIWAVVARIPYGETRSYSEVGRQMGYPLAARAVGQANARNPIAIIIPCHRVIGADGRLVGYGGGLDRKRALLNLEAHTRRGHSRPPVTDP